MCSSFPYSTARSLPTTPSEPTLWIQQRGEDFLSVFSNFSVWPLVSFESHASHSEFPHTVHLGGFPIRIAAGANQFQLKQDIAYEGRILNDDNSLFHLRKDVRGAESPDTLSHLPTWWAGW